MENREKLKSFLAKHLETIVTIFLVFGVIIFCVIYQPKKVQPILELVGLKKIDENTPGDIDKAITKFIKEANKKIPKGSHIIVRKGDLKAPNNAIKNYIHWKIMQNFTKRSDIYVYGNVNWVNRVCIRDIVDDLFEKHCLFDRVSRDSIDIDTNASVVDIRENEEIFTISARLEEFEGISSDKAIDKLLGDNLGDDGYYNYKFFISMEKNGRDEYAKSILMKEYAIMDENFLEFLTKTSLKRMENPIEEVAGDSLTEQECIAELEKSLLSLGEKGKQSKQEGVWFEDKDCHNWENEEGVDCEYKSKCFTYHYAFDVEVVEIYIKNNVPIKGCSAGNIWEYPWDYGSDITCYNVPKNPDCISITPQRIKDIKCPPHPYNDGDGEVLD